jgi:hypothetical protein
MASPCPVTIDSRTSLIARKLSVGYTTVLRILEHHTAQQ